MRYVTRFALCAAIAVSCPALASASLIINHDQQGTSGDFTVTGHDYPTPLSIDIGVHNVDYVLFGVDNGAFSSDLTNAPSGTPSGSSPTSYLDSGSTTLGSLRGFLTSEGLTLAQQDNLFVFLDANQTQSGDAPGTFNTNDFTVDILDAGNSVVQTWSLANPTNNTPIILQDENGFSKADYRFAVTGGMNLNSFPDADTIRFTLNMDGLNAGNELMWIDTEAQSQVPEPSALFMSLLAVGTGLVMVRWPRRTRKVL